MVKKIFAEPKVLPSLFENSLKIKAKAIESALSRIYNFSILLFLKNNIKNSYAKINYKKRYIYEKWNNLRVSLIDVFNAKNNTKIRNFKKIIKRLKTNCS